MSEPQFDYDSKNGWRNARRQGVNVPHRSGQRRALARLVKLGHTVRELTPYQYRIDEKIDVFITNNRYHDLKTGERGSYETLSKWVQMQGRVGG